MRKRHKEKFEQSEKGGLAAILGGKKHQKKLGKKSKKHHRSMY